MQFTKKESHPKNQKPHLLFFYNTIISPFQGFIYATLYFSTKMSPLRGLEMPFWMVGNYWILNLNIHLKLSSVNALPFHSLFIIHISSLLSFELKLLTSPSFPTPVSFFLSLNFELKLLPLTCFLAFDF